MPTPDDDPRTALPPNTPDELVALLESRRPQLLAYIERRIGATLRRKIEPLDVYQETAIAALNAWPTLNLGDRDPFGWLCQVAEQRIIDAHRRFAARKRDADREVSAHAAPADASRELIDLLAASLTSASQALARNERQRLLDAALAQMPAETREVLRLRFTENLPTKEIAEKIGKSDGAVRVMLTRTLHKLQQLLGPEAAP
ncbi:MAG TPA: sigma-70 family RNA polymerase sigma factor [Gemmataceae bacterium]|jgi:RNA polymerase sigma-70 factor (ECF subfamily)